MWDFIKDRHQQILYDAFQHVYLVVLAVIIAMVIAVVLAVLVTTFPRILGIPTAPTANSLSAIGLTIPSFALIGLLLPLTHIGANTALICVCFYAIFPILRNAVVGLDGVDATLIESARGMGMGEIAILARIKVPLAWPVILAGIRVSLQMSMGVAAIAALVLGPGLGSYIFTGLAQVGGTNAVNYALVATLAIVILALALDLLLLLLGRLTISKGIRAS
ncbi:MAG: ABC transporter permease subunit [Nocardioides sp.]|uniref:ABC transporter permease n=1 Tax=Nocardioides sp. TaxID=35761 RepID=UPI0039E4AD21